MLNKTRGEEAATHNSPELQAALKESVGREILDVIERLPRAVRLVDGQGNESVEQALVRAFYLIRDWTETQTATSGVAA